MYRVTSIPPPQKRKTNTHKQNNGACGIKGMVVDNNSLETFEYISPPQTGVHMPIVIDNNSINAIELASPPQTNVHMEVRNNSLIATEAISPPCFETPEHRHVFETPVKQKSGGKIKTPTTNKIVPQEPLTCWNGHNREHIMI